MYATMVNQGFLLWCYITPVLGAVVAEQYLGRVKTIIYSSTIYICGLTMLFMSSLPIAQDLGVSLAGLLSALFFIGIGAGGIKANVSSLIAEQYAGPNEAKRVLNSGEEVIVDRALTIERYPSHYILSTFNQTKTNTIARIFSTFYLFISIGSFGPLLTTTIEQKHGFSAAFALPILVFLLGFIVILSSKNQYITRPPESSIVFNACHAFWIALKHKGNLDYARPSYLAEAASASGSRSELEPESNLPWPDTFIDDLKTALSSCKIFLLYPIYWAAYTQFVTNFVSQAATMKTHGIPNDIMPNIDTFSVLLLLPLIDRVIFPFLRRHGLPVRHIDRITLGFILIGTSMLYATFVQRAIYASPPCYNHPRAPDCLGGKVPNQISIFVQAPAYILVAGSEILASVAGIEYAYTKAPVSMKSLVMAGYLSATSVGALLAMTVSPLTVDPLLPWLYVTLGLENFLAGGVLWFVFV